MTKTKGNKIMKTSENRQSINLNLGELRNLAGTKSQKERERIVRERYFPKAGYNGWINYETWAVKLWIDNDQGLAEQLQDEAKTWANTDKKDAAYGLSQVLKDQFTENHPLPDASLYTDLLTAALGEVDWYEIAEHLLEEMEAV